MNALDTLRALPQVRRGWPAEDGTLTFESFDEHNRLRAGRISHDGAAQLTEFAQDVKLPALQPPQDAQALKVHRLHRRAVLIGKDRVRKCVREGKATRIARATTDIGRLCAMAELGSAQVLATASTSVDFSLLSGRTLHELGAGGMDGWSHFATRWPDVACQPLNSLPAHSASDEAAVLDRWVRMAEQFDALPELAALRRAADTVTSRLLSGPQDTSVLLHRDLHDKQLLWDGMTLSILDVDTAARGEAALDMGNLLAHAELRQLQGVFTPAVREAVAAGVHNLASALGVTPARLTIYRQAAMLRLACVYAFRPSFSEHQQAWLDLCLTPSL